MGVSGAVTLAALPAAFLVIRALLRSPLGGRLVAEPTGERWHGSTTPTFGGIGIYCGFIAGVAAAVLAGVLEPTTELLGIVGGCTVIFVAGLLDDAFGLKPIAKLLAQFAAAGIAIGSGLHVELFTNDIVAVVVAVAWLVGITNAFNLLDNMDGLAATLATVAHAFTSPSTRLSSTTTSSSPFSRSRSASHASASCRSISGVARTPRCSWATVAASCSASGSRASGSPRAGPLQARPSRR